MPRERDGNECGPYTPVGELVLRPPVHVHRDSSIHHAAAAMREGAVSALVIDTHPVSFLTERDLVQALAEGRDPAEAVCAIATRSPVWVPPTMTVSHAAALMVGLGFRHLLVVGPDGEPTGVLAAQDAVALLLHDRDPDGWLAALDVGLGGG